MDIQHLRYFLDVARAGNISRAASLNYIPQSAMSRCISKLEEELGTKLFDRSSNKIILNEDGAEFARTINSILHQLDDAVTELSDDHQTPRGTVNVLSLQYRPIIAECISSFMLKYPNVKFNISHDYGKLKSFEQGVCVSSYMPTSVPCEQKLLLREELFLAVNKNNRLAKYDKLKLRSLVGEPIIALSRENSLWRVPLDHFNRYGIDLSPDVECNDTYCLWRYVVENMCITFISPISWKMFPMDEIKLIKIDEPDFYRDTYLFWPKVDKQSYTTHVFKEYLVQWFAGLAVGGRGAAAERLPVQE